MNSVVTGSLTALFFSLRFNDQTEPGRICWSLRFWRLAGPIGPLLFYEQ